LQVKKLDDAVSVHLPHPLNDRPAPTLLSEASDSDESTAAAGESMGPRAPSLKKRSHPLTMIWKMIFLGERLKRTLFRPDRE
jgi:hypothetical protein